MTITLDGTAGMTAPAGAVYNGIQSFSTQPTTSGTTVDFTSIPSWVKRITIMYNGVSTNGTSNFLVQIGSGSVTNTGYSGYAIAVQSAATSGGTNTNSTGFTVATSINADTNTQFGIVVLATMGSNLWVQQGTLSSNIRQTVSGGSITLSGVLDRVRITSVTPDTFDAGSVNILYE